MWRGILGKNIGMTQFFTEDGRRVGVTVVQAGPCPVLQLKATAIVSVLSLVYLPIYFLFYFRGFDIAPWWVLALHGFNQGVLNVIVGLWIWSWSTPVLGPSVAGRFPPMIPVVGTLLAIPVLGEIPSGLQIGGIALIIAGLFVASWRRPTTAR